MEALHQWLKDELALAQWVSGFATFLVVIVALFDFDTLNWPTSIL